MKRPSQRFSDREIQTLLKGLREDVAAPADFRGRVMGRLQAEGLVAAPARPVQPAWSLRLAAWFNPARLGLGVAATLAFVFLGLRPSGQSLDAPAVAPTVQAQAPQAPAREPLMARAPKRAAVPSAAAETPLETAELSGRAAEPALGRSESDALPQSLQVSSADVVSKPTVVVVKPEPTPLTKPLPGDSEVRNNVIRASRGEAALILYKVRLAGRVRIEIHDRLGRPVAVLVDRDHAAGEHSVGWTGSADEGGMAASGIYQVRVLAPGYEARHKVLLAK